MPLVANTRISTLINSQVPFFVRNDHPKFVTFLEKYYEYLEQQDKVLNEMKVITSFQDIDITDNKYAQRLYNIFMKFLPRRMLADKDLVLKNIKDFYRAKGTEKSVRFLFNILYDIQDVSFYYPKEDILKASDGKWYIQKSIRVANTEINGVSNTNIYGLQKYINTEIRGNTSNATAIVESVDKYFLQGTEVAELVLSGIKKDFDEGEDIFTQFTEENVTSTLVSSVFGGIVNSIKVVEPGTNYQVGDPVVIVSADEGAGACAIVSQVTTGSLASISVVSGGAGFQNSDLLLVSGGGGSEGNARIGLVIDDNSVHPNSYNIVASTISLEANTRIDNATYSNLSAGAVPDPANSAIQDSMSYWTYANTGPASIIYLIDGGTNYTSVPDISVIANSAIQSLGILGRMEIIDGGLGYAVDDNIIFTNITGGYGTGAYANVTSVEANGYITGVAFKQLPGHIIGGAGYDIDFLPTATVVSGTGTGANIAVTAILGTGAEFTSTTTNIGSIELISVLDGGSNYRIIPTIDLSGSGDGTATATANIVSGVETAEGRFINDDGMLSAFNFLQDRDYYQIHSYVIGAKKPINKYRQVLNDLTHPAGTKMFGRYIHSNNGNTTNMYSNTAADPSVISLVYEDRQFTKVGNTINITIPAHTLSISDTIGVNFKPTDYIPSAVVIDNATIYKGSKLTGITNSRLGTIAFWIKLDEDYDPDETKIIFNCFGGKIRVALATDGRVLLQARNANGAVVLQQKHNTNINDGNWHHVVASWNTNLQNRSYMAVDGIVERITDSWSNSEIIALSQTDYTIGAINFRGQKKINCHLSDFLFWHNVTANIATTDNLAMFMSNTTQLPVDPDSSGGLIETLGNPIVRLTGPPESWHENLGYGKGFSVSGEIIASISNPSSNDAISSGEFVIQNTSVNHVILTQKSSLANVTITQRGLDYPYGYKPQAVRFNGTSHYMTREADLDGNANSKVGTISCWFRTNSNVGYSQQFLTNTGTAFRLGLNATGRIVIIAENEAGTIILNQTASGLSSPDKIDGDWHHVVASWNLAEPGSGFIMVDGEEQAITTTFTDDWIDYTVANWSIGALVGGANPYKGDLADLIFWNNKHLYVNTASNLAIFYANSKPVNPYTANGAITTLGTPIIHLNSYPANTWNINLGSGGNFTYQSSKMPEATTNPNPDAAGANLSNGFLRVEGSFNGNVSYTTNARGALITATVEDPGYGYTSIPTIYLDANSAFLPVVTATITYANNSSGNVDVRIVQSRASPNNE